MAAAIAGFLLSEKTSSTRSGISVLVLRSWSRAGSGAGTTVGAVYLFLSTSPSRTGCGQQAQLCGTYNSQWNSIFLASSERNITFTNYGVFPWFSLISKGDILMGDNFCRKSLLKGESGKMSWLWQIAAYISERSRNKIVEEVWPTLFFIFRGGHTSYYFEFLLFSEI